MNWVQVITIEENVNKNTDALIEELRKFIKEYLGDTEVQE